MVIELVGVVVAGFFAELIANVKLRPESIIVFISTVSVVELLIAQVDE
jgi:hypothetical protein